MDGVGLIGTVVGTQKRIEIGEYLSYVRHTDTTSNDTKKNTKTYPESGDALWEWYYKQELRVEGDIPIDPMHLALGGILMWILAHVIQI